MFKVLLKLNPKKSGSVLNGYKDEDVLISVNGIIVEEFISEAELRDALDSSFNSQEHYIYALVERNGDNFSRKVKTKNNGFGFEVIM